MLSVRISRFRGGGPYHISVSFTSLVLTETGCILECDCRQLEVLLNSSPKCSCHAHLGSLLEQIKMTSGSWRAAIDLVNVLFSIPIRKEDQKQVTFTWDRQEYTFLVLS